MSTCRRCGRGGPEPLTTREKSLARWAGDDALAACCVAETGSTDMALTLLHGAEEHLAELRRLLTARGLPFFKIEEDE